MSKKKILVTISKTNLQTNGAICGLFRGLIVGMIFATIIANIGLINFNKDDGNEYSIVNSLSLIQQENFENTAEFLYRKVRVLCFILPISKSTLNERGDIFMNVWPKRCHKFIFFADEEDNRFNETVVVLNDRRNNWTRLREALVYIYKHHMEDFDWILKANDNSYIIMENLRWLLYQYNSDWPLFIGQRYLMEDYMMGVYIISKEAFLRLIENAFINQDYCSENGYDSEKEIAKCLQHVNVIQIDGIDDTGRGLFFHSSPETLMAPERQDKDFDKWYWHKLQQGIENCCSDRIIGIQNIHGTRLYYMEYFIYKVHAFGRHRSYESLPQPKTLDEIMKELK